MFFRRLFTLLLVITGVIASATASDDTTASATSEAPTTALSKSQGPPSFFLRDLNDGLCVAGAKFKRCGVDTLWYVTGKTGAYQLHHRLTDENDEDEDTCLGKSQCHLDQADAQLGSCDHCGAKKWNILGDAETGYVLTQESNKNCIKREGDKLMVIKCDKGYSAFTLQCNVSHTYLFAIS